VCLLETSFQHIFHKILFIQEINSSIRIFIYSVSINFHRRRVIFILLQIFQPFTYTRISHCPENISSSIRICLQISFQRSLFGKVYGTCKSKIIIVVKRELSVLLWTFSGYQYHTTSSSCTINSR